MWIESVFTFLGFTLFFSAYILYDFCLLWLTQFLLGYLNFLKGFLKHNLSSS